MLDTDTVSFALRGHEGIEARLLQHSPSEICISALTVAELRYGATRRQSQRIHSTIDDFLSSATVVPFDEPAANQYGTVASRLAAAGSLIGEFDALIAAHAIALDVTLVTNNVKHFSRVDGLRVENWA